MTHRNDLDTPQRQNEARLHAAPARPAGVRTLTSAQLFTTHDEVQIEHHGAIYRLKQTSLGKLILTK